MSTLTAPPAFGDFTRLDDNTVKLVAYTIVSLLRDKELIMPGGQDQTLVVDSMTPDQFVAQIIGAYVVSDGYKTYLQSKDYLKLTPEERRDQPKYFRVYYVVSQRWPREPMKFEERQIRTLEEIKNRL